MANAHSTMDAGRQSVYCYHHETFCVWLDIFRSTSNDYDLHKLLLGTHTSNGEQNYLMVAAVKLPTADTDFVENSLTNPPSAKGKIEIKIKILHQGEVNRARYMPQNPFIVATKSPCADVFVFDMSKHPSVPSAGKGFCPEHHCTGHSKEGYGLSWNPHRTGQLLSGSDDAQICLWDVNEAGQSVPCVASWNGHLDVIEDVAWHQQCPTIFGSVGDDRRFLLWDARANHTERPMILVDHAHDDDINTLAFSPQNEFLGVTGSTDATVKLWDLRNTSGAVYTLRGHHKEVFQLQWSPCNESVVASCGADRRVNIWDLSRIGTDASPSDVDNAPKELLFVHGGHTSKVSDFSWNTIDPWVFSSVSEDNVLQIWKPADFARGQFPVKS